MSRTQALVPTALFCLFAMLTGCGRARDRGYGYCDPSGCRACSDSNQINCWALPYRPCSSASGCAAGETCTDIGCATTCHYDGDCRAGESCNDQGLCAPSGVTIAPVGGAGSNPPAAMACSSDAACGATAMCIRAACRPVDRSVCGIPAPLCAADADCGAGRVCLRGACRASCSSPGSEARCPVGQACAMGVCADSAPATAECLWDLDCGADARCINATCHPRCTTASQCGHLEVCDAGVCRADVRAAML
jgi:hypothetical protein